MDIFLSHTLLTKKELNMKKMHIFFVIAALLGFLAICIVSGSFYTIDEGNRGVILRNGKFTGVAEPGLGFKIPFVDDVKMVSVRGMSQSYPKLQAYSKDQQPADLTVSVSFRLPPNEVQALYSSYSTVENFVTRVIERQVPTQVENVFGQYTAISAVQNRVKLVADLNTAIKNSIPGPVVIESIQIENIDFSKAYEKSVEDRMKAEVDVQTQNQNWEKEKITAQIEVTRAEAAAKAKKVAAEAQAESIRMIGEAEAGVIRSRGAALSENKNVIELTKVEKWNGVLPTSMVPNGAVPFIDVNSTKQ